MSSDEDFSLVTEPNGESLSQIQDSISKFKKKYDQLTEEQKELSDCRDERRQLAEQFKQRRDKLLLAMEEDEEAHSRELNDQLAKLDALKQDEMELMKEIQKAEAALKKEEDRNEQLKQQTNVFAAVPERKLVFKGKTGSASNMEAFEMRSQVVYPMEGGTALVTFEEEAVAKKILALKHHNVDLGDDCRIMLEARPVVLMLPRLVEIDTDVCPRRILISDLPTMDTETLLNKLEIHFSKSRNKGGEVEECEMLPDSGTVVVTFVEEDVAKNLTETEYHDVTLLQKRHKVRVTPFLNGTITSLKTKMAPCPRTVLLTGIPAIMERENLQDLLEIHFQKNGNGGGEIEAFLYNPQGHSSYALFSSGGEQEQ
ncbi:interferon-induced 35 kDa protein [Salarias fasciatus]|uniref:RRM domain-containing protein n=1 Tax=Salarias fasciatus TaxID=181472 RepID=A0A672FBE3_SALFA|nr:interferon-induced 35 kDa protein [Salarias fasciatus]